MPAKIDPNDWDRLFVPDAPRRGGPLQVLVNLLIMGVVLGILAYGVLIVVERRAQQTATNIAYATSQAATVIPQQTATALAQTSTAVAQTATAAAQPAGPKEVLGTGTVVRGGNLRKEPRLATETILGLIWPGDEIQFLEPREVNGQFWYRIRVTRAAPDRPGTGVADGTEGWASATLLSSVTPTP
ncbi:MAG: SH3 domain-containing protein [Roseiflexaceae bacterium]|nr:SH3 domain-containing protein [Roseiflexaceae bacterium]